MTKQLIILGGGSSVIEGINKGLFDILQNKFTIGLNYSYRYIKSTFQMFVDWNFYEKEKKLLNKLPLIIGQKLKEIKNPLDNTFLLSSTCDYTRDLNSGVYKPTLCGLFSLSFAIWLLDIGEIFLLGFDNKAIKKNQSLTHWYQAREFKNIYTDRMEQINHRGINKVNWYNATQIENGKRISKVEHEYKVYKNESKVKIYNVSMESKIPTFEKIDYYEFFWKLDDQVYDQDILRNQVKEKIKLLVKK